MTVKASDVVELNKEKRLHVLKQFHLDSQRQQFQNPGKDNDVERLADISMKCSRGYGTTRKQEGQDVQSVLQRCCWVSDRLVLTTRRPPGARRSGSELPEAERRGVALPGDVDVERGL